MESGDTSHGYPVEDYDTRREFIEAEFIGPDDCPTGCELPPWWEHNAPDHITDACQLDDNLVRYVEHGYQVEIDRSSTFTFTARVKLGYNDVDIARSHFHVTQRGYIEDCIDGWVIVKLDSFEQEEAMDAVSSLIDQERTYQSDVEDLTDALSYYDG